MRDYSAMADPRTAAERERDDLRLRLDEAERLLREVRAERDEAIAKLNSFRSRVAGLTAAARAYVAHARGPVGGGR